MFATNHALLGMCASIAINHRGKTVTSRKMRTLAASAPLLAIASHFILDPVPHFGGTAWYQDTSPVFPLVLAVDGLLTLTVIAITGWMSYKRNHNHGDVLRTIACGCAATSPDALFLLRKRVVSPDWWFYRFHEGIQWYEHPSGGLVELCFMIGMALLIMRHFKARPTGDDAKQSR